MTKQDARHVDEQSSQLPFDRSEAESAVSH
jgi:hypothetical protein